MATDDDKEQLRKMLRELPKVPAAPDFEARLQRRLAAARGGRRWWVWGGALRRPAIAYSAVTVLIVGFISYLALERTHVAPPSDAGGQMSDSVAGQQPTPAVQPQPERRKENIVRQVPKGAERPVGKIVPRETKVRATAEEPRQKLDEAPATEPSPAPARMMSKPSMAPEAAATAAQLPDDSLLSARDRARIDSLARTDSAAAAALRHFLILRARKLKKP